MAIECPRCGSDDLELVERLDDGRRKVRCVSCGEDWIRGETERQRGPSRSAEKGQGDDPGGPLRMFVDDDDAYLAWTRRNPGGFVLNCHRKPNADYLMLHRSFCQTITEPGSQATTWTMHDYIKVCSTDRNKVKAWATEQTDGKVTLCQTCW